MSTHHNHSGPGIEMSDADIGFVVKIMVGILLAVGLCMAIVVVQYQFELSMQPKAEPGAFSHEGKMPPEPRLQAFPAKDLVTFNAAQHSKVETYGWVDKEAGIARIPVDKAIESVLKNGFPKRAEGAKPAAKPAEAPKK